MALGLLCLGPPLRQHAAQVGVTDLVAGQGHLDLHRARFRRTAGSVDDHRLQRLTGHLLGGAGAIESIFTLLALRDRLVPPTANLVDKDPEITLDVAAGAPRERPQGPIAAINNSFGFGGHDVAVVFRSV